MPPLIEARNVSKRFMLYHNRSSSLKERFLGLLDRSRREVAEEFWALQDVSLSVGPGEALGLIGRNGSGKSTLLKLIAGIHRPTAGDLFVGQGSQIGTMIELGLGFHPELSGTENVFLSAAIHGLARAQIEAIYDRIVEYSGLRHFMDVPLKNYSSGMHMRLGFAIAANLDPDILLIDEIFAVGDEDFQKQCLGTMQRFGSQGTTIVFVSHTPAAVRAICRRACVLDHGRLRFDGSVEEALDQYHRLLESTSQPHVREPIAMAEASSGAGARAEAENAAGAEIGGDEGDDALLTVLRREGVSPHDRVLTIGFGGPGTDGAFRRYFGDGRLTQVGWAGVPRLLDLRAVEGRFEYILAPSLFQHLTLNSVARCIAAALGKLSPGGRFFATYFENPDASDFAPITRPGGLTTYADDEPYHYALETLYRISSTLGGEAAPVKSGELPGGETLLEIRPRSRDLRPS